MKTFKHKTTKEIAKLCEDDNNFYRVNDSLVMPKRFIENTNDWTEIIEEKLCVPIKTKFQYSNINPDSAIIYTIDSVENDIVKITWNNSNNHTHFFVSKCNEKFNNKSWTIYREYEILSLRTNTFTAITCSSIDIDAFLNKEKSTLKWQIKSIKRVSDNAIFTIGDKIKGKSGVVCTINEIWLNPNCESQVLFNHKDEGVDLQNALKSLFISDDNVHIFKGDIIYPVNTTSFNHNQPVPIATGESVTKYGKGYKHFSTKAASDDFILMHKPCLSLNEININVGLTDTCYGTTILGQLKEVVKNKL